MQRIALLWIAAANLLAAGQRPHYGGTLRIEIRAVVRNLDPTDIAIEPAEAAAKEQLIGQVYETLVRLDDRGEPQPLLATAWIHDTARRKWVFSARSKVQFHNGVPWAPPGGVISIADDRPIEQILRDLARPRNALVIRGSDGALVGTGPFRLAQFEPNTSIVLAANENYWGGRPFLDSIEIRMGRPLREQALDFEMGRADIAEILITEVRRARQRGSIVLQSPLLETLAIVFDNAATPAQREAVALSLDRSAIQSVLLQKWGETSGALAPQWLSGYAFVFPTDRDLIKARQLAAGSAPLSFSYDRQDPVLQSVAERIALNAAEAGLTLRTTTGSPGLRLIRLRATQPDLEWTLDQFALALPPVQRAASGWEREQALLEGFRVIPIVHLPASYLVNPRVRQWNPAVRWTLADVWLPEARP
ncbi:ABC transporter substrate-binding protein [Paludibaculum fermentans]|uniref:ABC transporter substrate-binding protein n=1 Tax=Paludibaculum fermentans TaxID=1473598 RepID=UPI003EBB0286